jgi:hypothetical protein
MEGGEGEGDVSLTRSELEEDPPSLFGGGGGMSI